MIPPNRRDTDLHPAAYQGIDGRSFAADRAIYEPIADQSARQVVDEFLIPVRSGEAWEVPAGHVCRFSIVEGPQVVDLNLWNATDPRERFWAARTRQFHGAHLSTWDRLWSNLPFLRPLATVVADTVGYGLDEDGAGCHDLLGTRCDPYVRQLMTATSYDFHCHSNLTRAVLPFGLTEFDVHDVVNLFQVTGLRADDERYYMKRCPAVVGDHFELFAETNLLLAASTCPGGDLAVPLWGPDAGKEFNCNPVQVTVYRVPDAHLRAWRPPERVRYPNTSALPHGLRPPDGHPGLGPTAAGTDGAKPPTSRDSATQR